MKQRLKVYGRVLVLLGVAAWIPYFALKYLVQQEDVSIAPFLTVHLLGVIPGALLVRSESLLRWVRKVRSRE
jgi:hypothetical protein